MRFRTPCWPPWGRASGLLAGASVRTWLIGILKHKITDQFWRRGREVQLQDPEDVAEADDAPDEGNFAASGHWRNMG